MQNPALTPTQKMAYDKALKEIEACRLGRKRTLDLSNLGLSSLPPAIGQLTALTVLVLGAKKRQGATFSLKLM